LKNAVTASVEARGPERNAPEASVGLSLGPGDQSLFPPEEAGSIFLALSTKKSAPYDSKRTGLTPGPRKHLALTTFFFKELKCYGISIQLRTDDFVLRVAKIWAEKTLLVNSKPFQA
jgi:hypothetical protein